MALVDVGKIIYPRLFFQENNTDTTVSSAAYADLAIYDNSHRLTWVGQAERDMTVTHVSTYLATISTGGTLRAAFQTVSAAGLPSGALISAGASGDAAIVTGDSNSWVTLSLTTPVTIASGTFFAIVFSVPAPSASISISSYPPAHATVNKLPVTGVSIDSGGSWIRTNLGIMSCYLTLDDATHPLIDGLTSYYGPLQRLNVDGASAPDEYAQKITVPMPCRVTGVRVLFGDPLQDAAHTLVVSDSTGTVIREVAVNPKIYYSTNDDGYRSIYLTSPLILAAGDVIYFGLRMDSSGGATQLYPAWLNIATGAKSACNTGEACSLATRTWTAGTPGAWTETTNSALMASLIIDQLSDVVDAGGYFGGMEPVPYPGVELQPQILYKSIFDTPGAYILSATGWTNSGNGAITRLIDPFSNIVWEADANTSEGVVVFPHPVSANAIGVARHNLDGHTITIEYSDDDGVTWYPAGAFSPAAGRILFEPLTGIYTADTWRFTVTGPTPAEISHLSLGIAAAFERRMYSGVVPSMLDREPKVSVGGGSGGQHVGDRLIRERVRQKFDVNNLTGEWVRVIGKPLIEGARDHSVFAAWRRGKYPNDIVYGFTDGDMTTGHAGPANYMDFNADVEGIDSWN